MKIHTHPGNLELLKQTIDNEFPTKSLFGVEIITNPYMEQYHWTGKYLLPDGFKVAHEGFTMPWGRFATWEEKDIPFLLKYGYIRKLMEPYFLKIADFDYRTLWNDLPVMMPPPYIVTSCV